jgi:putative peptidoglycan lipid II flippase
MAFLVVPSSVALLACGGIITAALFQTGRFTADDSAYVWAILAGPALGLLPAAMARLYSSCFYALHDTRTPLRTSLARVFTAMLAGYFASVHLVPALGFDRRYGAVALTFVAGAAGWLEFLLLRRRLDHRIGRSRLPIQFLARVVMAALAGAAAALLLDHAVTAPPVARAALTLVPFGATYLGLAWWLGLDEAKALARRLRLG